MRFLADFFLKVIAYAPDKSVSSALNQHSLWTVLDMAEKRINESQEKITSLVDELFANRSKFADKVPDFVEQQQQDLERQLIEPEPEDDDLDDLIEVVDDDEVFEVDPDAARLERIEQIRQSGKGLGWFRFEEKPEEQKQKMYLDTVRDELLRKCQQYTQERKRLLESIAMSSKTDAEKIKEINKHFLDSKSDKNTFWDVWERAQEITLKKYSSEDSLAPSFAWKRLFDLVTGDQDDEEKIKEIKKDFLNPKADTLWGVLDKAQNTILEKYPDKSSFAQIYAMIELKSIISCDKTEAEKIDEINKRFIDAPTNGKSLWDVVQIAHESLIERGLDASEYRKLARTLNTILQSGKSDEERIAEIESQPQFRSCLSELRCNVLKDIAKFAQANILQRFPDKDSIAQKSALRELEMCVSNDKSIEEKVSTLLNRFMDGTQGINLKMVISALQGNLAAQFGLAQAYANGTGFWKDADKAKRWYLMSASKGYADAQAVLGDIFSKTDIKEAANWYIKAAENGNTEAQYKLGEFYSSGKIDSSDPEVDAQKWYAEAAKNGHVDAMFKCGQIHAAAKAGHPDALYQIALEAAASQRYDLFKREDAIDLFKEAASKGNQKAREICSRYREMVRYAKKAEAGDPDAQYELGLCYEKCPEKCFSQMAIRLFTLAATRGKHEGAMKKLGVKAFSGFLSWLKN